MSGENDLTSMTVAREQEELERKILEGLDSPSRELTAEDWRELRSALRKQLTSGHRTQ